MAFDLEKFAETSDRVRWEDLDFDVFETEPLDAETLRSLRYMCDVVYHTSCHLRDLLVTRSHREDEARGFMTTWNREEFWHGEALSAVAAYRRLSEMTSHPALSPLLERIAQQETRHVAFYTTQAREMLETSESARKWVRMVMTKVWKPVGSGIMDDAEILHVMKHLFTGEGRALDKLDQRVARFPGMEDTSIFRTAFTELGIAV